MRASEKMHGLEAYLRMLWGIGRPVLPLPQSGERTAPFISSLGIHLPARARTWSLAATAHAGAHLAFTRAQLPWSSRKPITRALIGLLEDARVEGLALRAYPGLRRLWLPCHVASPADGGGFASLLARLARALSDDAYADPHPWMAKARRLFAEAGGCDAEPAALDRAASHLGNDIGQMRLQFNDRDHVVLPDYRDDNRWLWEAEGAEELTVSPPAPSVDSAGDGGPPIDSEPETLFRYPEWDRHIRRLRPDWCTVHERRAASSPDTAHAVPSVPAVTRILRARTAATRIRRSREHDGDEIDTSALITAAIDRRTRLPVDGRIHRRAVHVRAPLAVLVLLDSSASTAQAFAGSGQSVLATATAVADGIASACTALGIPCAVHAFRSAGRAEVEYLRIADPSVPWDSAARSTLAGLTSMHSTRLGAALRHATARWRQRREPHRLVLLLTDGEPHDIDVHDARYLTEDARHAVDDARRGGVQIGALGLAPDCAPILRRMLGPNGWAVLRTNESLPRALAHLLA